MLFAVPLQGRLIYGGARDKMLKHFLAYGHECPTQYNPADFVLFMSQVRKKKLRKNLSPFKKLKDNNTWYINNQRIRASDT